MKLFTLCFLLISCSKSFDLGGEDQFNVEVSKEELEAPSWDYPVYQIVELKCASCHSRKRDQFVPTITPSYYDDILDLDFFTYNKNEILDRIMNEENIMPPNYSTPLSPREKKALINFIKTL